MSQPEQLAVLTFVVDVETGSAQVNPAGLLHVASLFDRTRVPATWGFLASSHSRPLQILLGRLPAADVAIALPNAEGEAGDPAFLAQALEDRCQLLQRLGKHPSAVLLTDGCVPTRSDLFVKHKIRWVIEPGGSKTRRTRSTTSDLVERSPRYGVWSAQPSWTIPDGSSWSGAWMRLAARRRLVTIVQHQQSVVARVSLAGLVRMPKAWDTFEEVLRAAAKWRNRGKLQLESLAGLSLKLRPPQNARMRSILRGAA